MAPIRLHIRMIHVWVCSIVRPLSIAVVIRPRSSRVLMSRARLIPTAAQLGRMKAPVDMAMPIMPRVKMKTPGSSAMYSLVIMASRFRVAPYWVR